jgi:hypothetical protein
LRALAVSTALNALYLMVFGDALLEPLRARSLPALEKSVDVHAAGFWALVLLFVVPALLACSEFWARRWKWPANVRDRRLQPATIAKYGWMRPAYFPSSRTWDYMFTDVGNLWVRVKHVDGAWTGGLLGHQSMAASFPEPLALFLERAWVMGEHGEFHREDLGTHGVYVNCEDVVKVETFNGWKDPPGKLPLGGGEEQQHE